MSNMFVSSFCTAAFPLVTRDHSRVSHCVEGTIMTGVWAQPMPFLWNQSFDLLMH